MELTISASCAWFDRSARCAGCGWPSWWACWAWSGCWSCSASDARHAIPGDGDSSAALRVSIADMSGPVLSRSRQPTDARAADFVDRCSRGRTRGRACGVRSVARPNSAGLEFGSGHTHQADRGGRAPVRRAGYQWRLPPRDRRGQAGQRNTAAARYHFGTKQGLVDAIFRHRMQPINARRMSMLAASTRRVAATSCAAWPRRTCTR